MTKYPVYIYDIFDNYIKQSTLKKKIYYTVA